MLQMRPFYCTVDRKLDVPVKLEDRLEKLASCLRSAVIGQHVEKHELRSATRSESGCKGSKQL